MTRGPKKHMKRLAAPKHWMMDKLSGVYAPKCKPGAHKGREALPLILILRNRLKYALNRGETMMIAKQRFVQVDNRVRTDPKYPVGFMDILSIPKTQDRFRVMYDVKGRFVLHPCSEDLKLCKVTQCYTANNNVPTLTTHDGRTIRYAEPLISKGDTIQIDINTSKIVDFVKFKVGTYVMVTGGANTGRVGEVVDVEKHPGSFDIVHVKDTNNNTFATRKQNIFVIGRRESEVLIELPKQKGLRMPLTQDRETRIATYARNKAGKTKKMS
ncbi:40S ribosomal protein S4 [Diplonema papillatum]|nr:40S ribosomal protein S4 [Diplonema papillatum]|eukprot:gene5730-8760_t